VIVLIDGWMLNEHFDNRRHGKKVGDTMTLNQLPK
jgi:hypothetical protein